MPDVEFEPREDEAMASCGSLAALALAVPRSSSSQYSSLPLSLCALEAMDFFLVLLFQNSKSMIIFQ
jgi:hypothetical protein